VVNVLESLREIGKRDDHAIDIAEAALLLAALDRAGDSLGPYRETLAKIARQARECTTRAHSIDMQVAALTDLLVGRYGFRGDNETYDDPRNANLMYVIDRRRGLPVALGILWMHAARAYDAGVVGLAFPSHFLIRLSSRGQRAILDPFNGGRMLGAEDLRRMIKDLSGADREIEPADYAPVSNRDVLIRLQNNIKLRALAAHDAARALDVLQTMTLLAPDRGELWWETALLHSRLGNMRTAITTLETYLAGRTDIGVRTEIQDLLERLRSKIN
jgi:regulator of sirC expression with transglutaminase-like and TPR domain